MLLVYQNRHKVASRKPRSTGTVAEVAGLIVAFTAVIGAAAYIAAATLSLWPFVGWAALAALVMAYRAAHGC